MLVAQGLVFRLLTWMALVCLKHRIAPIRATLNFVLGLPILVLGGLWRGVWWLLTWFLPLNTPSGEVKCKGAVNVNEVDFDETDGDRDEVGVDNDGNDDFVSDSLERQALPLLSRGNTNNSNEVKVVKNVAFRK